MIKYSLFILMLLAAHTTNTVKITNQTGGELNFVRIKDMIDKNSLEQVELPNVRLPHGFSFNDSDTREIRVNQVTYPTHNLDEIIFTLDENGILIVSTKVQQNSKPIFPMIIAPTVID